jgi:hypothetical protein
MASNLACAARKVLLVVSLALVNRAICRPPVDDDSARVRRELGHRISTKLVLRRFDQVAQDAATRSLPSHPWK